MDSCSSSLSSSYGSSVATSSTEILFPSRNTESPTGISSTHNFLVRECPRSLWQSDSDAPVCSMMLCNKAFRTPAPFSLLSFLNPGLHRHHCRQCGRVVCGDCSKGAKYMLSSQPGSLSSKPVLLRVCDACLHSTETFEFKPPDLQSPSESAVRRSKSFSRQMSCVSDFQPSVILPRPQSLSDLRRSALLAESRLNCTRSDDNNAAHLTKKDSAFAASDDDQNSQADTPVQDQEHGPITCVSPTKGSSPRKIPAGDRRGMAGRDLEASSYYQGLLRHEPAALRVLLVTALENRPGQGEAAESG